MGASHLCFRLDCVLEFPVTHPLSLYFFPSVTDIFKIHIYHFWWLMYYSSWKMWKVQRSISTTTVTHFYYSQKATEPGPFCLLCNMQPERRCSWVGQAWGDGRPKSQICLPEDRGRGVHGLKNQACMGLRLGERWLELRKSEEICGLSMHDQISWFLDGLLFRTCQCSMLWGWSLGASDIQRSPMEHLHRPK